MVDVGWRRLVCSLTTDGDDIGWGRLAREIVTGGEEVVVWKRLICGLTTVAVNLGWLWLMCDLTIDGGVVRCIVWGRLVRDIVTDGEELCWKRLICDLTKDNEDVGWRRLPRGLTTGVGWRRLVCWLTTYVEDVGWRRLLCKLIETVVDWGKDVNWTVFGWGVIKLTIGRLKFILGSGFCNGRVTGLKTATFECSNVVSSWLIYVSFSIDWLKSLVVSSLTVGSVLLWSEMICNNKTYFKHKKYKIYI